MTSVLKMCSYYNGYTILHCTELLHSWGNCAFVRSFKTSPNTELSSVLLSMFSYCSLKVFLQCRSPILFNSTLLLLLYDITTPVPKHNLSSASSSCCTNPIPFKIKAFSDMWCYKHITKVLWTTEVLELFAS